MNLAISANTPTTLLEFCVEGHTILEFGLAVSVLNDSTMAAVTLNIDGVAHAMTTDVNSSTFNHLSLNYRGKISSESEISVSILANDESDIPA